MQPDQDQFGQPNPQPSTTSGQTFFPPYQAPEGQPQPYMGAPTPTLPSPQPQQGSPVMSHNASRGSSKSLLFALIIFIILTHGASGFAGWAYTQMLDYKNNSDKKAAAAVEAAVKKESDRKDSEFIDKEKQPYKTYTSSNVTGSLKITYPKTWSGYVAEENQATPLDAVWHPDVVPGLESKTSYALHAQVSNTKFDDVLRTFDSQVKAGKVKINPYVDKNVPSVTGVRVEGEIETGQNAVMVVFPLRDKTIMISTESRDFVTDFDNVVMANFTFTP